MGESIDLRDRLQRLGFLSSLPTHQVIPEGIKSTGSGGAKPVGVPAATKTERAAADAAEKKAAATKKKKAAGDAPANAEKGEKASTKLANLGIGDRAAVFTTNAEAGYYRFNGPKNERYSITKFAELAPAEACPAVWLSKSDHGHVYCQHPAQAGHTTRNGGAHAVPAGWQKRYLSLILIAASVATASSSELTRATHVNRATVGGHAPAASPASVAAIRSARNRYTGAAMLDNHSVGFIAGSPATAEVEFIIGSLSIAEDKLTDGSPSITEVGLIAGSPSLAEVELTDGLPSIA